MWLFWRARAGTTAPPPQIVRLTTLAGTEDWPAFSPDGQQVAFAWDGDKRDNVDIYVTLVGSTNVRRLTTDPADDYAPSWSPDGLHIAFLRQTANVAHIHVMSALGGPDRQVSDYPVAGTVPFSPAASQITWSPDGRYIAAGRDPAGGGENVRRYLPHPGARGSASCSHTPGASRVRFFSSVLSGCPADDVCVLCQARRVLACCTTQRIVTCVSSTLTLRMARWVQPEHSRSSPRTNWTVSPGRATANQCCSMKRGAASISGVSG